MIGLLLLQVATTQGAIPIIAPTYPVPTQQRAPIPASAKAVVDHVDALWKGDIRGSLAFVASDVVVSISDGKKTVKSFSPGKESAHAMYLAMTSNGKLSASAMGCTPDPEFVRCTLWFGKGQGTRRFTMRYAADGGPITRILSWENHEKIVR